MAKQKKPPKKRVKKQTSERRKNQIPRKQPSPHLRDAETKSHSDFDSEHGIGELIGLVKLRAVEIKGALLQSRKTLNDLLTHFTTAADETHGLADEAVFLSGPTTARKPISRLRLGRIRFRAPWAWA